jgi:uridine kinase
MTVYLIGICGGSGAGKTWLVAELARRLGAVCAQLSLDEFYRDRSHLPPQRRALINFDHPRAVDWILLRQVLEQLQKARVVSLPQYDFATHTRKTEGRRAEPKPLILLEGLWVWHKLAIRRLLARRYFLECPRSERLRRRIVRDVTERDRTEAAVLRQFTSQVEPMFDQFVEPLREHADLVLESPLLKTTVDRLSADLLQLVGPEDR